MDKFGVQIALEAIAEARSDWGKAQAKFNADVEMLMDRLLAEAARNFMSAEQVAKYSGLTIKRIRALMRNQGLDPFQGKRMLAANAAEVLENNAALLSIEPWEIDLTSPLAYLPMGSDMRAKFLETHAKPVVCTVPGCNCDIEYRATQHAKSQENKG